jgi:hypothetical protein
MDRVSSDEILAVCETIRSHEREIESIDIAILNILREVHQLRAKRTQHLDAIAKCRGSISLARRAPDDVLALIFESAAASGWANAPLVTSHVCAKWRRASFSPRVWSRIHLTSESLDPIAKTRLWLSRALQSPLHVTVDVRVLDTYIFIAFESILDHASQWRTLTVSARFVEQATDILSRCRLPIPGLHNLNITSFSIGVPTEQGVDELAGLEETFVYTPSLSVIRIVCNRFPPSLPQTVVDLSLELTDIPSSRPSLSTALQMLGTLPTLQSLTLIIAPYFAQHVDGIEDDRSDTCLHHLEHLIVDAPPDFNEVLRHIQAPILRCLHLRSAEPPFNHPHQGTGKALLRFLRSSNPPIRLLELYDVDICRDDFVQCFLSLPLLEELRLHETEISNDALVSLHGPIGACPRLKRLDLRWCEQLTGQALVDLVRSRVGPSGHYRASFDPIEEITVINCALVNETNVLDLAHATVCNVVVRNLKDHCRTPSSSSAYRTHLTHDQALAVVVIIHGIDSDCGFDTRGTWDLRRCPILSSC